MNTGKNNSHTFNALGCLGVSRLNEKRQQDDYYATHPLAAEALCQLIDLNKNIWECACGEGHLSKVFEKHGHIVKSTDLVDRGFGKGGIDFLSCYEHFNGDIVTNPLFKLAEDFIIHALELIDDGNKVCMFLKVQFLEGKSRKILFKKYPPKYVYVSSSRITCSKDGGIFGGSMIAYAWYIWEKGYKGDTILRWFN